jgi:FSR family fosmidomycin resistance protein-like MFS transporter
VAALVGFIYGLSFTSAVVLGQDCLPERVGLTSAVTLGAAMGASGLVAGLLGPVADDAGLETVIIVIAALPLPALALSLLFRRRGVWECEMRDDDDRLCALVRMTVAVRPARPS